MAKRWDFGVIGKKIQKKCFLLQSVEDFDIIIKLEGLVAWQVV